MKKAATFIGIGFELIALVWFADAIGTHLEKNYGWKSANAYAVLIAFVFWFTHMVFMAKGAMNDEED